MRKFRISYVIILMLFIYSTFCIGQQSSTAIVDLDAQEMRLIKVADSNVIVLVHDVVFHHNGAIIVCDSAIRYSDRMMECYGNVIINNDSTLIYGDMADFIGDIAHVYSPIVKTVDGDMTMYSYDLEFNTLTSVGRYTKGGTITQKDNLMESQEAIYYADSREVFFSKEVSMRNDEYILTTDSMGYNFDTEITTFYTKAYIWNKDDNFLTADRGSYNRMTDTYTFTENSFIMTEDHQTWADSIIYNQAAEVSHLFNNVQIIDEEQKVMIFGDYGIYWGIEENAMMTKNPAVVGYDTSEGQDSTFMRSDSIFFYTVNFADTDNEELQYHIFNEMEAMERILAGEAEDYDESGLEEIDLHFEPIILNEEQEILQDTLEVADLVTDSTPDNAGVVYDSIKTLEYRFSPEEMDRLDSLIPPDSRIPLDTIRYEGVPDIEILEEEEETIEIPKTKKEIKREQREMKRMAKREAQRAQLLERLRVQEANDKIDIPVEDSIVELHVPDSLIDMDMLIEEDEIILDSIQRIMRAYRDVRVFRGTVQAVCDSMVAFSTDSTLHMYIDPILWNEDSQITSDIMHFYTRNEELYKAEFEGQPLLVEAVVDSLYNQLASRIMNAYFVNNNIYMMEAIGNAQSYYYYQEDEESDEVNGFSTTECSFINFFFEDNKIVEIRWHDDVDYALYPMDKIPETQSEYMRNFKWEIDRRPKSRFDVFNRRIRESVREEMSAIPQPDFKITGEIEDYKIRLINEGIWRDRTEDIWVNPQQFVK
ncbi:MAG: hypothetical protein LIO79_09235 [Rikenellaceae bacterium]|nr:hypothetical protein [Rikenellaceae bacterium]